MTVGKLEAEGRKQSLRKSWGGKNRLSSYFTSEFPSLTVYPALALSYLIYSWLYQRWSYLIDRYVLKNIVTDISIAMG